MNLKVGDKVVVVGVAIWGNRDTIRSINTVTKVLKNYVVLDNNTKWNLYGSPYPREKGYHIPHIELLTDEHLHKIRCSKMRNRIERWSQKELLTAKAETLEAIYAIIKDDDKDKTL